MIWLLVLLGLVACVLLSALYSGAETGMYQLNRLRHKLDLDRGVAQAQRVDRFVRREHDALSTLLVGTNVANYLTTALVAAVFTRMLFDRPSLIELYTTLTVTPLLFVFGEVLPKTLFQRNPDRLLYWVATPLNFSRVLFAPAVWCLGKLVQPVLARLDPAQGMATSVHADQRHRMAGMLHDALASYEMSERHGELVDRALALSDIAVHEVMVPLDRVVALPETTERSEFVRLMKRNRHSRYPIFRGNRHHIVGIVNVHKLIDDSQWQTLAERMDEVLRIDRSVSVSLAIVMAQRAERSMAVVMGKSGKALGIVTLKDLLEEIVGELADL